MAKWVRATNDEPEFTWASGHTTVLARPNIAEPWMVDIEIETPEKLIAFSLHRDEMRALGYRLEEHDWHYNLRSWDDDEGILE